VESPRERPKRKYRPKAEQTRTPAKAEIAAARPRDARGHFLPLPDSRRARIRAANAALPEAQTALAGDGEQLLADFARSRGTDDAAYRAGNGALSVC